jgi:hypothetical protein
MSLQNRVTPFGELISTSARGTLMGNRGGKFHAANRTLTSRRWASRQWICCVLDFKNRQRDVWGRYYTELFFLDEVTAFAAGHRPCFECRRRDAELFARLFSGKNKRASAGAMDRALHAERLDDKAKRTCRRTVDMLPDGAMIALDGEALCCPRQPSAALDTLGLRDIKSTTARNEGRGAYPTIDRFCAFTRIQADLASKRAVASRRLDRRNFSWSGRASCPGKDHDGRHDREHGRTSATHAGQPPRCHARPPSGAPKLPPT